MTRSCFSLLGSSLWRARRVEVDVLFWFFIFFHLCFLFSFSLYTEIIGDAKILAPTASYSLTKNVAF